MSGQSSHDIERRPIPGTDRFLSEIALSVDPPAAAPPSADARMAALLRRAHEYGVTTFDVVGARFPGRAERVIANAFPIPDPELGVLVGRSVESLARERSLAREAKGPESLRAALEESLEESRRRLEPVSITVVEWSADPKSESWDPVGAPLPPSAGAHGAQALWCVRLPPKSISLPDVPSSVLLSGELSLLDLELIPLFHSSTGSPGRGLLVRNPFSDGRLDGSRFAATTSLVGPGTGPVDLRRMHADFDPVVALGFLTRDRQRTLAQAALRFVLGWPWVVTTSIPVPPPERFEEVLRFGATPPLGDDELDRLGLLK